MIQVRMPGDHKGCLLTNTYNEFADTDEDQIISVQMNS
jgi:hypothetical protein